MGLPELGFSGASAIRGLRQRLKILFPSAETPTGCLLAIKSGNLRFIQIHGYLCIKCSKVNFNVLPMLKRRLTGTEKTSCFEGAVIRLINAIAQDSGPGSPLVGDKSIDQWIELFFVNTMKDGFQIDPNHPGEAMLQHSRQRAFFKTFRHDFPSFLSK